MHFLRFTSCALGLTILIACNQQNRRAEENPSVADTSTLHTLEAQQDKLLDQDSIALTLVDGKAAQKATMEKGRHVVFSFHNDQINSTLQAVVKPAIAGGNVRIAQIFTPQGTADGPFGPQMSYKLTEKGVYRLVVSENLMAGDPYDGAFTLNISVDQTEN